MCLLSYSDLREPYILRQTIYEFSIRNVAKDCAICISLRRNGIEKTAKDSSASEPSPSCSGDEEELDLKDELVKTV